MGNLRVSPDEEYSSARHQNLESRGHIGHLRMTVTFRMPTFRICGLIITYRQRTVI